MIALQLKKVIGKSPVISETFNCKTITPLLMHGKDNKHTAEVRTTSFIGLFRYWFRALEPELSKTTFQKETNLFGGTNPVSLKSKLLVSITPPSDDQYEYSTRPHRTFRNGNSAKSAGIPENTSFNIHLQTFKKDESYFDKLVTYAKLSFLLGGFGMRSRRGFGSIDITNGQKFQTPEQWLAYVQQLITSVSDIPVEHKNNRLIAARNNHRINHPRLLGVYIGDSYQSSHEALVAINQTSSIVKKKFGPALGDINDRRRKGAKPSGYKGEGEKLATPLIASVKPIGENYFIVVTEVQNTKFPNDPVYENAKKMFLEEVGATY